MILLEVRHRTLYRYAQPVTFGQHRAMLRPRGGHDLRVRNSRLTISPKASVRWIHDVFSNSVTLIDFEEPGDHLLIESVLEVEHYAVERPELILSPGTETYPFSYVPEEVADLGRTRERHYPDPERKIDDWARKLLNDSGKTDTRELLARMNSAVHEQFKYGERHDYGTQPPLETLEKGSGTCRDFALFMMEAARSLGFAARFVSGYLYVPALDGNNGGHVGGGATHAWVQIYLPGAGWIEYDPTNDLISGPDLIRVAVTRDPSQALPVSGTFTGSPSDFVGLEVAVDVKAKNGTTGPASEMTQPGTTTAPPGTTAAAA